MEKARSFRPFPLGPGIGIEASRPYPPDGIVFRLDEFATEKFDLNRISRLGFHQPASELGGLLKVGAHDSARNGSTATNVGFWPEAELGE